MDDSVSSSASAVPLIPTQPVSLTLTLRRNRWIPGAGMHLALIIMKIAVHLKC